MLGSKARPTTVLDEGLATGLAPAPAGSAAVVSPAVAGVPPGDPARRRLSAVTSSHRRVVQAPTFAAAAVDAGAGATRPRIARRRERESAQATGRPEHRCAVCGYGVIVSDPPPACPMCRTNSWDPIVRAPLAHLDRLQTHAVVDELAARRLLPRRSPR